MKKIYKSIILTTLTLIVCLIFTHNSSLRLGNTIFNMNDKKYDDNGAGKIQYPTNLKDNEGIFDIVNFKVKKEKDEFSFEYRLSNIINNYNNTNGFSNVLIDTYISVGKDGLLTTFDYGAAVNFNEDYPWTYHIRITPEEYYIEKLVDKVNRVTERLECNLDVDGKTIKLTTSKSNIGEDLKKSKYYVFTGGYDIFGSDNYRRVVDDENEWDFYGGIKSVYQPNILDVVSPIQERMLVYFMPPMYAILSPVYNQAHQLIFKEEIVYLLIIILFGLKYFNLYKQYKEIKEADVEVTKTEEPEKVEIKKDDETENSTIKEENLDDN